MNSLLLCTDLDRTLLPNGRQPESDGARQVFARLAALPQIELVYVTGRDLGLATESMAEYGLPDPGHLIADVGTAIYSRQRDQWRRWTDWDRKILGDWGRSNTELRDLLAGIEGLRLQEDSRQAAAKLSYYLSLAEDPETVLTAVRQRIAAFAVRANLVFSRDEQETVGLLDILPASATKLHAIEYLLARTGRNADRVVFAGDSGNDLDVLVSPLRAVLVANASRELKDEVRNLAGKLGRLDLLHVAGGGFLGLNGNYAGGILEGVAHFFPEVATWLEGAA